MGKTYPEELSDTSYMLGTKGGPQKAKQQIEDLTENAIPQYIDDDEKIVIPDADSVTKLISPTFVRTPLHTKVPSTLCLECRRGSASRSYGHLLDLGS